MGGALFLWLACLAAFLWCARRAPAGWQDAEGFHFGSPET